MLSPSQAEQVERFLKSIEDMERKQSSMNFQVLCGLNKNEADVLAVAPFMVNIITQLIAGEKNNVY